MKKIDLSKKHYRLGYFDRLEDAANAVSEMKKILDLRSLSDTSIDSQQSAA